MNSEYQTPPSRPSFIIYQVIDRPGGGAMFVMECLDLGKGLSKYAATLGEQLGR